MKDLGLPIALRRSRRSSIKIEPASDITLPPKTPAKTPRRGNKKRVRFSDPGMLSSSSGLTPMVSRVSVTTPRRRRHSSAPIEGSINDFVPKSPGLPQSGEVSFLPLRQVLDGRVQRRIRRNGLSEEMNTIQQEKRKRAQESRVEVERLKGELKARDREIYELQNATIIVDTDRIWGLEKQVQELQDQLNKKAKQSMGQDHGYNWTLGARDPFAGDLMDMTPDEDQFGDETMAQFVCSTPTRARSSLQTPPATSPLIPGTPRFLATPMPEVSKASTGVQTCLADPSQLRLEEEVESLHREVDKLKATLDSYKSLNTRLGEKLSDFTPSSNEEVSVSAASNLEGCIETLLQTMSDRTYALTQLTTAINNLGFSGTDASDMVTSLTSGFRAARLELEYLTPGEITLPLSSHGAEVLDLLLTRLRAMAKKAKEDEDSIDEYHEIELSLRKQLDARVTVMDGLKAEMGKAEKLMSSKMVRIRELEVANERLKGAVDGYIRDVSELEKLVQQMERDANNVEEDYGVQLEAKRRVLSKKEDSIAELEAKLAEALQRTIDLQKEMCSIREGSTQNLAALNKKHGIDLAARDAKVSEYRSEIDRVNEALRTAHAKICSLRVENGGLKMQMDKESEKAKAVIDSMKEELQRVVQMSQEFLKKPNNEESTTPPGPVVRHGAYLSGGLARRTSRKRGRDSGMGLLDEDEEEFF